MIIYQVFTRLFHSTHGLNKPFGTIDENGCGKFNNFTSSVLQSLKSMGFTHIWFTGVIRHATCTDYSQYGLENDNPRIVKGRAGSPYAIKDYFDVDPDLAENVAERMREFEALVDRCHRVGLRVIIDFVPNHVCRQYRSVSKPSQIPDLGEADDKSLFFSINNNFYYIDQPLLLPSDIDYPYFENSPQYNEYPAKATGNNVFHAYPTVNDWYETIKLNYGVDFRNNMCCFDPRPNTWDRMVEILKFWAKKKVDGFRVDMAEMVPIEFWEWAINEVKQKYRQLIFIAEVYNPHRSREFLNAGFDYLYDKEQFYNIMRDILKGNTLAWRLTSVWQEQEGIGNRMLRFLENHDEQRLASTFFCGNPEYAFPAFLVTATMHQGPLMVYFGQELGENASESEGFSGYDGRTTIFDYWTVPSIRRWLSSHQLGNEYLSDEERKVRSFYLKCLELRNQYKSVFEQRFFDLMYVNSDPALSNVFAYLRYNQYTMILIIASFDRNTEKDILLKIPPLAFEMMDISGNCSLVFSDFFEPELTITTSPQEAWEKGIPLHLKTLACMALVFRYQQ